MAKIDFYFPVAAVRGKISKKEDGIAIRYRNGKPYSYTYERHAPWSEEQVNGRALFGAATYFAYLVLRIGEAVPRLTDLMTQDGHYTRLSGFVAARLKLLLAQDGMLCGLALRAYAEYKEHRPCQAERLEEIRRMHMPLAQTLYERLVL